MNICLAYNVKPTIDPSEMGKQSCLDFDLPETIDLLAKKIKSLGHEVIRLEADNDAYLKLRENKDAIDLVFNIAEGLSGDARESQIPLFCEMLKIPYTHSTPTVHALSLDKNLSKLVVSSFGINVPRSILITKGERLNNLELDYPLIVKPNFEGSSIGVFNKNVVSNKVELEDALASMYSNGFVGSVLLEQFIDGREFTVSLIEDGGDVKVLPIVEQRFDFLPKGFKNIAGFELKWAIEDSLENLEDAYICPANIPDELRKKIEGASTKIFKGMGVRDCARIDFRLEEKGNLDGESRLYFIEINTLPGINLNESVISYFPLSARKGGISSEELLSMIIKSACRRYGLKTSK